MTPMLKEARGKSIKSPLGFTYFVILYIYVSFPMQNYGKGLSLYVLAK